MRLLVTGFSAYSQLEANPSAVIVQKLSEGVNGRHGYKIITDTLRTKFERAGRRIRSLIHDARPDAVVCLGVAPGVDSIQLERIALNLDDASEPDNAGEMPQSRLIEPNGPVAFWSTLPLPTMERALLRERVPVFVSNHAGTFVCNHACYAAHWEIERLGEDIKCGLIHLPLMTEQLGSLEASLPSLPITLMTNAVELCLNCLLENPDDAATVSPME